MTVKVCGMREAENIRQVELSGADLMGFIFYPKSSRYVSALPSYMPSLQKRVGVFVNSPLDEILSKAREFSLDYIQLHGNETPALCEAIKSEGLKVIRAISVKDEQDFSRAEEFRMADLLIFDTYTPAYGGSGQKFNWHLLESYKGRVPFLLSGGITPASAGDILGFSHPQMAGVDINSGFETAPALKDAEKVAGFIKLLKSKEEINHTI